MPLTQRQRDEHNLNPHKFAVAAMWLHSSAYAAQRGGAMDFWDSLSAERQQNCRRLVWDIEKARAETNTEKAYNVSL